jgi:hypothetical protein
VGLTNLGSESETCVGNRVRLVGVSISFEKNFYRLPFTPPLSGSPYRSFNVAKVKAGPDAEKGLAALELEVRDAAIEVMDNLDYEGDDGEA